MDRNLRGQAPYPSVVAIVPAAGRSQRMGRPKLILPVGEGTVIGLVIAALGQGGADRVVVIAPPREAAGAEVLIAEAEAAGAEVLVADAPTSDMRASVLLGIDALATGPRPRPAAVLLAPGDSAGITPALVARVIARFRAGPSAIIVPACDGRRGHPVLLPWALADEVRGLPAGVGINALLALRAADVVELDVDDPGAVLDLDTPEDYRRLVEPGD